MSLICSKLSNLELRVEIKAYFQDKCISNNIILSLFMLDDVGKGVNKLYPLTMLMVELTMIHMNHEFFRQKVVSPYFQSSYWGIKFFVVS